MEVFGWFSLIVLALIGFGTILAFIIPNGIELVKVIMYKAKKWAETRRMDIDETENAKRTRNDIRRMKRKARADKKLVEKELAKDKKEEKVEEKPTQEVKKEEPKQEEKIEVKEVEQPKEEPKVEVQPQVEAQKEVSQEQQATSSEQPTSYLDSIKANSNSLNIQ